MMTTMSSRTARATAQLVALAFDAMAPGQIARFWSLALGWDIHQADEAGAELAPRDGTSFRLVFLPAVEEKAGRNRIHLDLTTVSPEDQHDTVSRLLASGARHVDIGQGSREPHVVLADPDGNELCIIEPDNRFLAGCPRLGAVNCDGTRALGYFYSEALGWPLVWDEHEETAVQAPDGTGPKITWSGPPLMPRAGKERLHFHLAPARAAGAQAVLDRLLALGATRLGPGHGCAGAIPLADVDGNEVCLTQP